MLVYIDEDSLICEACAVNVIKDRKINNHPDTLDGPHSDGGGEADCPLHCSRCNVFLENPLTPDGYDYIKEATEKTGVPLEWAEFYDLSCHTPGKLQVLEFKDHYQINGTGEFELDEVASTPDNTKRDKDNAHRLAQVPNLIRLAEQYRNDCQARMDSLNAEFDDLDCPDSETKQDLWESEYKPQNDHWQATICQIDEVLTAETL